MYKRKNTYYPDQIWKKRFDQEYEFLIYKYLCKPMKTKEIKKIELEQRFVSFEDWENHIRSIFDDLPIYRKREFCKYLKNKSRKLDNGLFLTSIFTTPLIISIVGPVMLTYITEAGTSLSELASTMPIIGQNALWRLLFLMAGIAIVLIAGIIIALPILYFVWALCIPVYNYILDCGLKKSFWEDCEDIIKRQIKEEKEDLDDRKNEHHYLIS